MSNSVGDWYAPTYKINGYATQYTQQGFDGTHVWYVSATGTAGNAITFIEALKINQTGTLMPYQAPTISAPTYVKGGMYFDTTLNKLRIGGATAWETVTSV